MNTAAATNLAPKLFPQPCEQVSHYFDYGDVPSQANPLNLNLTTFIESQTTRKVSLQDFLGFQAIAPASAPSINLQQFHQMMDTGHTTIPVTSCSNLIDAHQKQQQQLQQQQQQQQNVNSVHTQIDYGNFIYNRGQKLTEQSLSIRDTNNTVDNENNETGKIRPRRKSSISSREESVYNRKIVEVSCSICGKRYKNHICLQKHSWEHHRSWHFAKKLSLNKHQSVQIMEAAHILINIRTNQTAPYGIDENVDVFDNYDFEQSPGSDEY